jgi:hypothetical protein
MLRIRRRWLVLRFCVLLGIVPPAGCKTQNQYDSVKKRYEIPGVGIVDEYKAQTLYKKKYGEYHEEGSPRVREVLERRERSRQHYGAGD